MTAFHDMPPATQAGILCGGDMFQRFASERCGTPQLGGAAAAEWLRQQCGISSRRELNTTPAAAARFATLCTDFDIWRGKITNPNR